MQYPKARVDVAEIPDTQCLAYKTFHINLSEGNGNYISFNRGTNTICRRQPSQISPDLED